MSFFSSLTGVFARAPNFGNFILGNGNVISGFFVRIIIVVVATYKGIADKINIPNTNPPKPRNCARIRRFHCAPLNISKLNIWYNIAQEKAIYAIVQIIACLLDLKKLISLVVILMFIIDYK